MSVNAAGDDASQHAEEEGEEEEDQGTGSAAGSSVYFTLLYHKNVLFVVTFRVKLWIR